MRSISVAAAALMLAFSAIPQTANAVYSCDQLDRTVPAGSPVAVNAYVQSCRSDDTNGSFRYLYWSNYTLIKSVSPLRQVILYSSTTHFQVVNMATGEVLDDQRTFSYGVTSTNYSDPTLQYIYVATEGERGDTSYSPCYSSATVRFGEGGPNGWTQIARSVHASDDPEGVLVCPPTAPYDMLP